MEKVVIVECISTSMHYVHDLRILGYEPVILETYNDDGGKEEARRQANYLNMEKPIPRRIQASPNYEETLELVKAENPILVLPGSEMSVILATSLAEDLGLKCNPKENLPQMTRKDEMHEACKKAGLRYIHGKMVKSADEAISFYNENNKGKVVLKPTHSAGTLGVHICSNKEQVINAFNDIYGSKNMFGDVNDEVLIQEHIDGKEYIVNTVSCEGENYITAVYVYKKDLQPDGTILYDYSESLNESEITPEISEIMEYAKKVINAIGIKYGPVHGEYMYDENGPVLMEVNCRICGGDMSLEFLEKMWGHHETNRSLEAYLFPEKFKERLNQGYKAAGKGFFKILQVRETIDIVDAPICRMAEKLPTFVFYTGIAPNKAMHLNKTIDLYSNGGKFALAGTDINQVIKDCKELSRIVDEEYDTIYTLA